MTAAPPTRRAARLRRLGPDALGIGWVLAAAAAVMAPALAHGASLGPFDWLASYGLSKQPGVAIHNRQTFDLVTEMIPWTSLSWTQVHHGHLPLWNPYNALGTPLAFNWQSATFSLPALVGYLFPLHLAYSVQVLTTLAVAGTGAYALGRLLGVGILGCVMAGTVYELSGAFFSWLGWPMAAVLSWAGWLFAAALLVVRGRRRSRAIAAVAVVVALAVYAGQPDALVLLAAALAVFVAALLVQRAPALGGSGGVGRAVLDLAVAGCAGAALGAPLLLPGAQLLTGSVRGAKGGSQALPVGDLVHVLLQGFDGSPAGRWFGSSFYMRTASYVGVIGIVLAALALAAASGRRRRRPEVVAVGVVAVAAAALTVLPPVVLGSVQWHRALLPMDFALAVLAGVGTDVLVRSRGARPRRWAVAGFASAAVFLLLVFALGRGSLPPGDAAARARSFVWPWSQCAVGLATMAVLTAWARSRRAGPSAGPEDPGRATPRWRRPRSVRWGAAAVLLGCETAFLVTAGASLWSSSPDFLAPTPAEVALRATVGSAVVGLGSDTCFTPDQLGTVPDVNAAFGIHEFAAYDPLLPHRYDSAWFAQTGQPPLLHHGTGIIPFTVFCPVVPSAQIARRYGIGYVLEHAGVPGPAGAVLVRRIAQEDLYRVPGAAAATLVAAARSGALPPVDARGTALRVTHPDPAAWRLATRSVGPAVVRLRLTDVPGWHATVDGRPVALQAYAGVMLQLRVPRGHHTVELRYRPAAFSVGIVLALVAVAASVVVPAGLRLRARWRRRTAGDTAGDTAGPVATGGVGALSDPA